jgi:hypothetical protein
VQDRHSRLKTLQNRKNKNNLVVQALISVKVASIKQKLYIKDIKIKINKLLKKNIKVNME